MSENHDVIYLQYHPDDDGVDGNPFWRELTWCEDKINDSDVKYLLATPKREAAPEMYEALKQASEWFEATGYQKGHSIYAVFGDYNPDIVIDDIIDALAKADGKD